MRTTGLVLLALSAACGGPTPTQYSDGAFVQDFDDPGENPVKDEVRSLPLRHLEWEYKFNNKQISRLTLAGSHLFVETPENQVIAMDRFTGKTEWIHKVDSDTPLDWPPVVAHGAPEEIIALENQLRLIARQIDDKLKEHGVGPETIKLQKKRQEIREKLRVAAFGDNVYFISRQTLYCLDRLSGNLRWTHRLKFVPSAQPFAIRNYVFIPGADLARVWALDVENRGTEVASYPASIHPRENHIMNKPVYSDPSLFFTCHDGNIYCYKVTDGTLTWTFPTERDLRCDPVVHTHREITKDEKGKDKIASTRFLFVGGMDHCFYALDADAGALVWKYEAGAVFKEPAVAKDTTVYVKSHDSALLALELLPMHRDPKTGASTGPKRNGNLRWKLPLGERFLLKGKERVYILGPRNVIYVMNEMTGEITGRYPLNLLQFALTNTGDDFLYVANSGGYVFCLKESKVSY